MGKKMRRSAVSKPDAVIKKYRALVGGHLVFRCFDKVKYELPVLAFLLGFYAKDHDFFQRDIYNILHIFDYRIGFAPRLFIGSLMSLFTSYKSAAFMNLFFNIVCLVSIAVFAVVSGRVIRRSDDEARGAAILFVLLFLAVPYSRTIFFPRLVSLERFLAMFTLLAFTAVGKKGFRWLVPLLIAVSLATYHGYAFTYMPAVAIVLLYETHRRKNSKPAVALCVVSFAAMAAFSAYFYLYRGVPGFESVEQLIQYSLDKTDIRDQVGEFKLDWVLQLLVLSPGEFWALSRHLGVLKNLNLEVTGILALLPLLLLFFLIWYFAFKKSTGRFEKLIYLLCLLAPLTRLPMLVLSQNYLRSRIAMVVAQFALLFYFLHAGDAAVTQQAKKIWGFFKEHYLALAALTAYYLFFVKLR
ncbi:MAG: hypothetical protein BWY37_01173 [Firmicutes bacterium ADurb.Bin262]|nr:MAG: hypothetical protein BWY37_01173 [Firmicutes bacterium ADurb.Bin262]